MYDKVMKIVDQIPEGKVTTYGHIARAIGASRSARMVGWVLNSNKGATDHPCHRVVNRLGELSGKMHFPTPTYMKEILENEGVTFSGESVNMKEHLWIPEIQDD